MKKKVAALFVLSTLFLTACGGPKQQSSSSSKSTSYEQFCPLTEDFDFGPYNDLDALKDLTDAKEEQTPFYSEVTNSGVSSSVSSSGPVIDGKAYYVKDAHGAYIKSPRSSATETYYVRANDYVDNVVKAVKLTMIKANVLNEVINDPNDLIALSHIKSNRYKFSGAYMSESLIYVDAEATKSMGDQEAVVYEESQVTRTGFCPYQDKINVTHTFADEAENYKDKELSYSQTSFANALTLGDYSIFDEFVSSFPTLNDFIDISKVDESDLALYDGENTYSYKVSYDGEGLGKVNLTAIAYVKVGGVNRKVTKILESTFNKDMVKTLSKKSLTDLDLEYSYEASFLKEEDQDIPDGLVIHNPKDYVAS